MKELDENITPANIGGMGPVSLPVDGELGSGDIPAGSGDAKKEYKKKKKKMKKLQNFESFTNKPLTISESVMAELDIIRQESDSISDFISNVFKTPGFKKFKGDKGFKQFLELTFDYAEEGELTEGRSINKIQKEYSKVVNDMAEVVVNWKAAKESGDAKAEANFLVKLKDLTSKKKSLMSELDDAVGIKDLNIELAESEEITEAAQKSSGLVQFAEDEKSEGKNAEIHLAVFNGTSIEAQSTTKTWDDGVPVTKYFTRGGFKKIAPKGDIYIIESNDWWYFENKGTWYAVKRADYGTPPFEY
jgi:hypothetical protein